MKDNKKENLLQIRKMDVLAIARLNFIESQIQQAISEYVKSQNVVKPEDIKTYGIDIAKQVIGFSTDNESFEISIDELIKHIPINNIVAEDENVISG